jgi:hypothetical protein
MLFHLNTLGAVAVDMELVTMATVSNHRSRVIRVSRPRCAAGLRLFYNYYLRNLSVASLGTDPAALFRAFRRRVRHRPLDRLGPGDDRDTSRHRDRRPAADHGRRSSSWDSLRLRHRVGTDTPAQETLFRRRGNG